ncbi:MAG: threonylcarbamoyl-AMP synthase [Deltaproteobacteria bacterium]|nr:threonylcarbamoyl-AMP synthase [Deltaproteobacteria bacterium]
MPPTLPEPAAMSRALMLLQAGQLVGLPTETVYGLAADGLNPFALRQIFAAKGRPVDHPLILHLGDAAWLPRYAEPDPRAEALAAALWPGPLTIVLRRKPGVPDEVTGGRETVALRVPAHPVAQALLWAFGRPLAAPSANRFGRVSPTTAEHVREELPGVFVLDGGPAVVGVESSIVDLSGPVPALLRPGGVSAEAIAAMVGPLGASQTVAPGTLPGHYAPRTALRLSHTPDAEAEAARAQGLTVAILRAGEPQDHARRLYAELRRLDALGVDLLLAEPSADAALGVAINDRLSRAAYGAKEPR